MSINTPSSKNDQDKTDNAPNAPIKAIGSEQGFWQRFHAPILLTIVGGGIDTIGFIGLLGFFTNHVTGNLVSAGSAIVKEDRGLWIDLAVLPVFIISVMITKRVIDVISPHKPILSYLLFAEVLFLTAFMTSALYFSPFADPGSLSLAFTGFLGLIGFAVRNTASKTVMNKMPPTLLMTGNTTQLGIDLSDYLFNRSSCNMESLKHSLAFVFSFVGGAFLGTLLYIQIGFWSIAPFIVPVLYLAFAARSAEFRRLHDMVPKK